jgi:hypothetical protein
MHDYSISINIISDIIRIQELDEIPLAELWWLLIKKHTEVSRRVGMFFGVVTL